MHGLPFFESMERNCDRLDVQHGIDAIHLILGHAEGIVFFVDFFFCHIELTEEITLDKNIKHNIEIVVDRLIVKPGIEKRLTDSIENVLDLAEGLMTVDVDGGKPIQFSQSFSCPDCNISIDEIEPRSFSFNNPFGACPDCFGLGYKMEFDEDLMIPDKRLSLAEGAIQVMGWQSSTDPSSFTYAILKALSEPAGF